jgi:hypothetical protein
MSQPTTSAISGLHHFAVSVRGLPASIARYQKVVQVRKRYPEAVLIEGVGGTTHAGSLSGVSCTDDRIATYLLTGALPTRLSGDRSDVQCEPVPLPDPAPAAGAAAAAGSGSAIQDRLPADLRRIIIQASTAR